MVAQVSVLFHLSSQKSVPFLAEEDLLPSENARTTKSGGQSICSKLVGMLQVNYGPSSAAKIGIESIAVFETYFFFFLFYQKAICEDISPPQFITIFFNQT